MAPVSTHGECADVCRWSEHAAERNAPSCGGVQWLSAFNRCQSSIGVDGRRERGRRHAAWSGVSSDRAGRRRWCGAGVRRGVPRPLATTTCWPSTTSSAPTQRCIPGGTALTTYTPPSTSPWFSSAIWPGDQSLEFVTGVIILPQRQTALVAKQAAKSICCPRATPVGDRHRLERRRVRGARRGFHQPRQAVRGTDHLDAAVVDRGVRDVRRQVPRGHGRRTRPTSPAAPHPGVDRCRLEAWVHACRQTRRRLVPDGGARPRTGGSPVRGGPGSPGRGTGSEVHRHGSLGQMAGRC